jgi:RNA polymerase sigma-70 factor (ECF subfamily)
MASAPGDQGTRLERYRGYLGFLARAHLAPGDRRLIDASDVVQQTLMKAHRYWDECHAESEGQRRAWLRAILVHQIADLARRSDHLPIVDPEASSQALDRSAAGLDTWVQANTPSLSSRAIQRERSLQLAKAISRAARRSANRHRASSPSWPDSSRVCHRMRRSPAAVAGLLRRGLKTLRARLHDEP